MKQFIVALVGGGALGALLAILALFGLDNDFVTVLVWTAAAAWGFYSRRIAEWLEKRNAGVQRANRIDP